MYYLIRHLCPRTDMYVGGHAFQINLHPKWKELVAASDLPNTAEGQRRVQQVIETHGREWLDVCGYNRLYDHTQPMLFDDDEPRAVKPGPNAKPLYAVNQIRVTWGAWGPEHISVPGNACGLDISRDSVGCVLGRGGVYLSPHNIDCWAQKQLLLLVFTELADHVVVSGLNYEGEIKPRPDKFPGEEPASEGTGP